MGVNTRRLSVTRPVTRFVIVSICVAGAAAAMAKDKKLPSGEASNDTVLVNGTALDSDQLKQIFGSDFDNGFAVIEVTLTPKGGKPVEIRMDDFLLRSDQTGEHTGPLLAGQIAGQGTLVLHRGDPPKSKGGFSGGFGGIMMGGGAMGAPTAVDNTKVEMKESGEKDPMLSVLKRKILPEKTVTEPVTGLLFFPLEKEKTKHLALIYTTPAGKLRMQFR
jgi:hypothetical protein